MAVRERQGDVVFLHQIVEGAADKSYGIHVAQLAGVPRGVNRRAAEILERLEREHHSAEAPPPSQAIPASPRAGELQLQLFDSYEHPVMEKLRRLSVDEMTPMQALLLLREWQESL